MFVTFLISWILLFELTDFISNHLFIIITILFFILTNLLQSRQKEKSSIVLKNLNSSRKSFITIYRSLNTIVTCICILAVDFQFFPRKYAKTEDYGISLVCFLNLIRFRLIINSKQKMDLGVGNIIFSGGLIASNKYIGKSLLNSMKKTLPVITLGFIRLISVKVSEYHVRAFQFCNALLILFFRNMKRNMEFIGISFLLLL